MKDKPKSGFLTSEFWMLVVTGALPVLGYVQDHTQGFAMLAAAALYAVVRGFVKAKA